MNKIKKYIESNKYLLITLTICILLIFGVYIFGKERFLLGYDYQYQHLYFYQDFHRLIKSGQMPFWSNNMFLGTDFWASKSYYILGDPFAYITLLFDSNNLINALLFTYILKFITAALLFNHFLTKLKIKDNIRFIPVLLYTFCGWATLFSEHPMFLVWHTFLPLLLIGVENVLQHNKYSTFIIATFILLISNYYFFFTTSIFLTFYWTIRYYQLKEFKFKTYFFDTLKLIGYYLIGVLMSMILILPSVLHLLGSPRVTGDLIITKKWNPIIIYLDMLVKSLIGPYKVNELGQMLFNTTEYATNQLTLYSSVLTILLLPQLFYCLKGKIKNGYLILLLIEFILLITPYGASLMHGFKEPTFRWTLLLITTQIIIVAQILNNKELINKKLLLFTTATILLIIIGLRFAVRCNYDAIWEHLLPEYNGLLIAGIICLIYCTTIYFNQYQKILLTILVVTLISEISFNAYKTLHRYPDFENYDYENIISDDAINYIKSLEDQNTFYRVYVPYADTKASMPHNINLYYDYKGAYTYDSLYQFDILPFIQNEIGYTWITWQLDIHDLKQLSKLGFKYYMVKNPEFNLGNERWMQNKIDISKLDNFKFLKQIDDYYIYEDTTYTPFPLKLSNLKDNKLIGTYNADTNKQLTIPITYDAGWNILVNNEKVTVTSNEGFISFNVQQGLNNIKMNFIPSGFKVGLILSIIGLVLLITTIKRNS